MPVRILHAVVLLCVLLACPRLSAADPKAPMVGPGATKDAVIDAYGWPSGQSQAGTKEILSYPQGQVTLENGKVEKVEFSMTSPWPAPRPRPGTIPAPKKEEPVNFWVTDFDRACREAARRNARVLALFTGSDWSQASKQFREQVAFDAEFVNAFTADFVFLELDYPNRAPQAPGLREQNARLRQRYGVTLYPTLLILSPGGNVVARPDLTKAPPGDGYRARVIAVVGEVRDQLIAQPPPPDPAPDAAASAVGGAAAPVAQLGPPRANSRLEAIAAVVQSARTLIVLGLLAGLGTAGALYWLVWRRPAAKRAPATQPMSARIGDAAAGLPAQSEFVQWSKQRLCALVTGLAEADGYQVEPRPEGGDVDLALRRGGDERPRVLVLCLAGHGPPISAKRVRELFASMTAEGVETGWLVAPGGFSTDARACAADNHVVLLGAENLSAQLRDLPPVMLPRVLARLNRPPGVTR